MFYVFTDGGARGNGKGVSSWGMAVYDENECYVGGKRRGFSKTCGHTNNFVELTAVLEALKWAEKTKTHVVIRTDSNYVNQGINTWMPNWIKNHWRTAKNRPIKNLELWREVYFLHKELNSLVTIEHVPGHSAGNDFNSIGNRQADLLCNVAMDEEEAYEWMYNQPE